MLYEVITAAGADRELRKWLAGDKQAANPGANLDAQVAMKIGTIGEVAVGAQVRNDYEEVVGSYKVV